MQPVLALEFAGRFLALPSYRTLLLLAVMVTVGLTLWVAVRRGLPVREAAACLLSMAAAAPVGARLLHAGINSDLYLREPDRLLSLDPGGFSLYGGLLLAAAVGWVACRVLGLEVTRLADASAPALGVGVAIARTGCFLAGCCFGKETDLPWAVTFPPGSNAHIYQIANGIGLFSAGPLPVHPTQLYELAAALGGACLAGWLLRRKTVDGTAFLAFIIWLSLFRWGNFYLRVQPTTLTIPTWFYPALYLGIIALCLYLLRRRYPVLTPRRVRSAGMGFSDLERKPGCESAPHRPASRLP
ncbi:MAG: prolipoprotein diacylglyceryl transferase [Chloroflexi bacterium]|nr:prolipoprotein diacylglyceryl transferase [Chloroflexota bacterium]